MDADEGMKTGSAMSEALQVGPRSLTCTLPQGALALEREDELLTRFPL